MLVLGIVAAGGEYRHRTIIPAMLITPRRGALVTAKAIAVAIAGVVLSGLTFGLGLATTVVELHAHGMHHLPPGTTGMFAGSVAAATLFGLIGVALGYITRSTVAAVVGAVGWVLFAEYAHLAHPGPPAGQLADQRHRLDAHQPPNATATPPLPPPPPPPSWAATPWCCSPSPPGSCGAATLPEEGQHAPDVQRAVHPDRRR